MFTGIIVYNYKDLSWVVTKFGTHIHLWLPYMCAKFQPDQSMHSRVRAVFVCLCEKKEKKKNEEKLKLWSLISMK